MINLHLMSPPSGEHAGKTFRGDSTQAYSAGSVFRSHLLSLTPEQFHQALPGISQKGKYFLVHAPPKGSASEALSINRRVHDRDGEPAHLDPLPMTRWVMFDFDLPLTARDREGWRDGGWDWLIGKIGAKPGIPPNTSFTVHLSSSFMRTKLSYHVFFVLDRGISYGALGAWAAACGADVAVCRPAQPHYVADPRFLDGAEDPLAGTPRWKFVERESIVWRFPEDMANQYPQNRPSRHIEDLVLGSPSTGADVSPNARRFIAAAQECPDGQRHAQMKHGAKMLARYLRSNAVSEADLAAWVSAWRGDHRREAANFLRFFCSL